MLRLSDLRKSFGPLVAVDGLSLDIHKGEVFGLLGPNGAGKSTTIGMCVGLLKPDSGSVTLDTLGAPSDPAVRRHVGVAPQSLALYDDMSGSENLRFFARMYSLSGHALRDRVAAVLDMVGLTPRAADLVRGYSGGMKRRLNLAVALLHEPPLLMLDEPTAGVDPQSRNSILDLVRDLAKAGKTILYTTHYMEEASRLCDRVGIIDKGRLLALGTVSSLVASHGGKSVVTVTRGSAEQRLESDDPLRDVAQLMHAEGTAIGDIR
ncbi:MAG: ABC transporter ATP-binding protein, partial [Phycisphaerales bacterium]